MTDNTKQTEQSIYDYRIVLPWAVPNIMKRHVLTGAMGRIYMTLSAGFILTAFAEELGFRK